jgi:WD40-like Beta Propeller Repeat
MTITSKQTTRTGTHEAMGQMTARRFRLGTLVLLCVLAGVVALGVSAASGAVSHEFLPGLSAKLSEGVPVVGPHGETTPVPGPWRSVAATTVDSGELFVTAPHEPGHSSTIDAFDAASGAFLSQFAISTPPFLYDGIAVGHSTGEAQVYVGGTGVVGVLNSAGALLGEWAGPEPANPPGGLFGCFACATASPDISVDGNPSSLGDWAAGDVYVADQLKGVVDVFKPLAGGGEEYITQLPGSTGVTFSRPDGVAVNPLDGEVVVVDKQAQGSSSPLSVDLFKPVEPVPGVHEYEFVGTLAGSLAGGSFGPVQGVTVDSGNGDIYVWEEASADQGASVDQFDAEGVLIGRLTGTPTGPSGEERGFRNIQVAVDPVSHDVYVTDYHGQEPSTVDVFGPNLVTPDVATLPASGARATGLGAIEASLNGTVNPKKEGEASCRFQWGTTPEFGHVASCEPEHVAEGSSPAPVHATLHGLASGTTYYYRLQASNKNGTNPSTPSQDQQFTTPGPGLSGESASNVTATSVTLDATINPHEHPTTYYFQYGKSSGYETTVPLAPGAPLGSGASEVEVAQHVQALSPATVYHYRVVAVSELAPGELESFPDQDETFTTQAASGGGGGSVLLDGRTWELVSPADKHGARIDPISGAGAVVQAAVGGDAMTFLARSPTESQPAGYADEVQVLSLRGPDGWVSRDISTPHEHATGQPVGFGEEYRFFSEDLSLGVVQPLGSFDPSLSVEASEQTAYLRTNYLHGNVSEPCVEACYRPLVTGKPGYANVPPGTIFGGESRCPSVICGPRFTGASPDLSHIVVNSEKTPLTAGGSAGEYEWAGGRLSPGNHLPGLRVSTSEDGSWTYSASGSVLAKGAVPGQCSPSGATRMEGSCNLYVSHGGVTRLVAVASGEDSKDWAVVPDSLSEGKYLNYYTSRVSPDGRWFAFMSQRGLTGYDTRDAVSGKPDEEVYLYHAPADLATEAGALVCASCDPTGARPVGVEYKKLDDELVGGFGVWGGNQGIAANIPGWTPYELSHSLYQSRYLSDSGRLFFNSSDALVPQDVNGNEDVYEYEPPGTGDCTTGSVRFSERSGGCVGLVSSGQAVGESAFLDASGNGGDVFFLTAAKLVSQDYDTALDVYDAHECTSQAPCFPAPVAVPPPCGTGDACKAAPSPQPAIFGASGSATFSGAGNVGATVPGAGVKAKSLTRAQKRARALKACHSRKGKRRRVCERQAKARYAARRSSMSAKKGRG